MNRREMLVMTAVAAVAGAAGCSGSDDDDSSRSAGRSTSTTAAGGAGAGAGAGCVLSPELTAGPYHLDDQLVRRDITEGSAGVPLDLRVRVLALPRCTPLAGAAVDVWHCDAGGEYSGWNGNTLAETAAGGRNDKRYLRGVQRTGDDGVAAFTTIFPGWYEGRSVHIHLRVVTGGHVSHVGQAFFDEALTARVLALDPYRAHTGSRTTNAQDTIFADAGAGAIAQLRPRAAGDLTQGFAGTFTCIVDPTATPTPV